MNSNLRRFDVAPDHEILKIALRRSMLKKISHETKDRKLENRLRMAEDVIEGMAKELSQTRQQLCEVTTKMNILLEKIKMLFDIDDV